MVFLMYILKLQLKLTFKVVLSQEESVLITTLVKNMKKFIEKS